MEESTPPIDDSKEKVCTSDTELDEKQITDYSIAKKLVQIKQSATSRGLQFDLSFKTVKKLLTTKKCYYTGKPFGKGVMDRSFDRVDSALGYVEGNVVACTIDINSKKANLTSLEIHQLSTKLKLHSLLKS